MTQHHEQASHPSAVEYFRKQVKELERLLEKSDFQAASLKIFSLYNNGHSGWTEWVVQIFRNPQGDEEQALVARMKAGMQQTAIGLLENASVATDLSEYMQLEQISRLLSRLGNEADPVAVQKIQDLLEVSEANGAGIYSLRHSQSNSHTR